MYATDQDDARGPDAAIATAESLMREFEYDEAATILEDALAGDATAAIADSAVELRARQLLVMARAASGDTEAAAAAAARLYERDPGYELLDAERISPPIRSVFTAAREQAAQRPPAEIEIEVRMVAETLTARLTSRVAGRITEVEMWTRALRSGGHESSATESWQRVELFRRGPVFEGILPLDEDFEYYARYLAPSGHAIAEAGSQRSPLRHRRSVLGAGSDVRDDDGGSSATWWIVMGGAVAAAGAVVGLLLWHPWVEEPTIDMPIHLP